MPDAASDAASDSTSGTASGVAPPPARPRTARSAPLRLALQAAGWACVGLALAGAVLPVLPTTPFLLLAAACFVRSSPGLHRHLLEHRRLGPYLRQWELDRSVPRQAKRRAYAVVVLTFAASIAVVASGPLRLVLAGLGLGVIALLVLLRTTEEHAQRQRAPAEVERASSAAARPSRPSETARA